MALIADEGVGPYGHIQGKLEGTHPMFLANGFENGAGDFSLCQGFADRGFDAVIIVRQVGTSAHRSDVRRARKLFPLR